MFVPAVVCQGQDLLEGVDCPIQDCLFCALRRFLFEEFLGGYWIFTCRLIILVRTDMVHRWHRINAMSSLYSPSAPLGKP